MIFVKLIDTDDTTDLVVAGDADQRNELAFICLGPFWHLTRELLFVGVFAFIFEQIKYYGSFRANI